MNTTLEKTQQSFETAEGEVFGDLLSAERIKANRTFKVGLLATGFFEYWRMYDDLRGLLVQDAQVVEERLSRRHHVVSAGLVDTVDSADAAGRRFRDENIQVLVLAYRSYIPDAYVHQILAYLPGVPLLIFASQSRDTVDYSDDYRGVLRNSGVMAQVQLVCGLRRVNSRPVKVECIAGSIHDESAYARIDRYLEVVELYHRLKTMTIGVMGSVFRGMYDFEFDATKVKGMLGPEILHVQLDHLGTAWDQAPLDDPEVQQAIEQARGSYRVTDLAPRDLEQACRASVALQRMVKRFRLDGLALLGQHFVERKLKTNPYLGLSELHRAGVPCVTEGDVIGLIMMKILHALTGRMPFFLEWSEFDVEINGWMLLGHGFCDPSQARDQPPLLTAAAEQWGLEGGGCSVACVPIPGPCTMAHFVEHPDGWKIFISRAELLDMDPLPIREVHAFVRVERPIRQYVEELAVAGLPHHAITVRGDVRAELEYLARLLGMKTVTL